jgi:GNAT superfamily N-acetyltransferase
MFGFSIQSLAMIALSACSNMTHQKSYFTIGESKYQIRPFESSQDQANLEIICKNVWKGTDYLPSKAMTYEADEYCDFVVVQNENNEIVALGNRRIFKINDGKNDDKNGKGDIAWIEAIRTSEQHAGKGIATALIKAFIERSKQDGIQEIMSCTIESNYAMAKVFHRVEMESGHKMYCPEFHTMSSLPGWGAHDKGQKAQTILDALNIKHLVRESNRKLQWSTIKNEEELKLELSKIKDAGGIGYLPGLGKPHFYDQNLKENLQKGLIRKLKGGDNCPQGLYALIEDSAIQSLKSKWVCSVVGLDNRIIEAALWDACSEAMVARRGEEPAFMPIFDGRILMDSPDSPLISALSIQNNLIFVLYSLHNS